MKKTTKISQVTAKKPKKKRYFLLTFLIIIALILLIIKFFLIDIISNYGLKAFEKKDYTTSANIFKGLAAIEVDNKEDLYYWASSLNNLPPFFDNQKELFEIAQKDDGSAGEVVASQALKKLKAHILTRTGSNYIEQALYNDTVMRWNLSKMPLTYYVDGYAGSPDYYLKNVGIAFNTWKQETNNLFNFQQVNTPDKADIRIVFKNENTLGECNPQIQKCEYSVGTTLPKVENHQLKYMDVKILTRNNLGKFFTEEEISKVLTHEIGHALGIWGHSENKSSIMYYSADKQYSYGPQRTLSGIDVNTIKLLYILYPDITNAPLSNIAKQRCILAKLFTEEVENNNTFEITKSIEFLNKNPNDINRWIGLAEAYGNNKDYQKGIETLKQALPLISDNESASIIFYNLANDYIALHDFSAAFACAQKAQSYSNDLDTRILLAYISILNKNFFIAEKDLNQLKQEYPNNLMVALNLADLYIEQKNYFKARSILKDFVKNNPDSKDDDRLQDYKIYMIF